VTRGGLLDRAPTDGGDTGRQGEGGDVGQAPAMPAKKELPPDKPA